ncbi:MAG: hypothetical protein K1X31_14645 [Gemmatimonadaceae bacterium]|nr:hypothetical protein [Gemmatimonadaceae bacterium]
MRPSLLRAALLALVLAPSRAPAQRPRARTAARDEAPATAVLAGGARTVRVGDATRRFTVRAPAGTAHPGPGLPLVLVLHGGGGNGANAERMSGFTALVRRERLIVAYPDGTGRRTGRLLTWNAAHCCGAAMERRVDDAAFLAAVIDAVAREFPVDPARIYITGMSNGAMMAHRAGRELSARIAAIGPVVGAVFGDEPTAPHPVSAIIFNGLADESVPALGGLGHGIGRRAWDGMPTRPNQAQGAYWARVNGCGATPRVEDQGAVIRWTWPCPPGRAVELYQLREGTHAWPGGEAGRRRGPAPSDVLDATAMMWDFFKAHPKPPATPSAAQPPEREPDADG